MKELKYSHIDKSAWGVGPWQSEPDKLQWQTAAGLLGLIVRNNGGALCGYVGISATHPYFGINYSGCTLTPKCDELYCSHLPELDVHGGLTFSDFCHAPTPAAWEKWRSNIRSRIAAAVQFPKGDMAEEIRTKGHLLDNYEAWCRYIESAAICHSPEDGEPDHVWWFGFDCAHSGDFCPKYAHIYESLHPESSIFADGHYRDLVYVRREVESLAEQLVKVAA